MSSISPRAKDSSLSISTSSDVIFCGWIEKQRLGYIEVNTGSLSAIVLHLDGGFFAVIVIRILGDDRWLSENVRAILMNDREEIYGTCCIVNRGIWDNYMLSGYANKIGGTICCDLSLKLTMYK